MNFTDEKDYIMRMIKEMVRVEIYHFQKLDSFHIRLTFYYTS